MKLSKSFSNQGFTLIEMVVVLVIIGIISVFSVPYFGGFANRTKLDSACHDWIAYANYARSEAATQGVNYRLTCDMDQQSYWLTYESPSTGVAGEYIAPGNSWGQVVNIDSSLRMVSIQVDQNQPQTSGVVTLSFTPRGTTNDAVLIFRNYDQDEKQIVLRGITGLAKIQSTDTTG